MINLIHNLQHAIKIARKQIFWTLWAIDKDGEADSTYTSGNFTLKASDMKPIEINAINVSSTNRVK